ncbi:hypothetical protein BT69DRAFT_1348200 [Atractiella rhizophila]|nr:hypothetical protein BT69DRAFT_1348200 [Atractiella rhizophila]
MLERDNSGQLTSCASVTDEGVKNLQTYHPLDLRNKSICYMSTAQSAPNNATQDIAADAVAAHRALSEALATRRTVGRIALGVGALARNKKFSLAARFLATTAQVVAFIVVLAITSKQDCDRPLRTFLAIHLSRVAISFPLKLYTALAPPRRNSDNNFTPSPVRIIGNERLDSRIRFFGDLCSLAALIIFLIGNYWFFSSHTCRQTSPTLFWSSLTALLFGYLYIAELALIAFGVIFFLPLIIIGIRFFGLYEKKPSVGPLTQDLIDKIPLVLYKPMRDPSSQTLEDGGQPSSDRLAYPPTTDSLHPSNSTVGPSTASYKKTMRFMRFFQGKKRRRPSSDKNLENGSVESPPYPFHEIHTDNATCSICLIDYEPVSEATTEYEPLRLLDCKHTFHKDCLDPWLAVSGRCPICQKEVFPGTSQKPNQRGRFRLPVGPSNDPPPNQRNSEQT